MANVLGTLFQNIANAIREKTGDTGTMKPAEFPEKIATISAGSGDDTVLTGVEITPNFASGNQTVTAEDGTVMKSVVLLKPSNLKPANILKGVTIAGIAGSLETDSESGEAKEYRVFGFSYDSTVKLFTFTHSFGYIDFGGGESGFFNDDNVAGCRMICTLATEGYDYTVGCQWNIGEGWIYDYRIHRDETIQIPYDGTPPTYTLPDCLEFSYEDSTYLEFKGCVKGNGDLVLSNSDGVIATYKIIVG